MGQENALLRTLLEVGNGSPPAFNPLTLCGPVGSGKSHLLRGLVERSTLFLSRGKAWFVTGADFARYYANAVELDSVAELRDRWNSAPMIVVDSLEELSSKPAAQEELLHLLDRCLERNCQFLGACRDVADQWDWMLPGLRSRLEGGLIIPIALPQPSTRTEIVRQLLQSNGASLSDEALQHLLAPQPGKLSSLATYPQLRAAVLEMLHNQQSPEPMQPGQMHPGQRRGEMGARQLNPELMRSIVRLVARHFELKASELSGSSRRRTVVQARGIAIYLARTRFGSSFEQLGRFFGDRDHTTILHAYRKVDDSLKTDAVVKQTVDKLWLQIATSH
jgi:chromosomal replication initiator protein